MHWLLGPEIAGLVQKTSALAGTQLAKHPQPSFWNGKTTEVNQ